jgi:hypothetical protein
MYQLVHTCYGWDLKYPPKLMHWSPLQHCLEVRVWGSDWIMKALISPMD